MKRRLSPLAAVVLLLLTAGCIETPSCGFGVDFSPDGKQVAFLDLTNQSIALVNVDGTGYRRIASIREFAYPAWSPDGRSILFADGKDLRLYNTLHRSTQQLARGIKAAGYVWSRDSRHIVCFLSDEPQAVWLDAASGEILLRVELPKRPDLLMHGTSAAWLPQTWGVAYIGERDIYVVEAGRTHQVTHTDDVNSLWVSPDGSRLRWVRAPEAHRATLVVHEYDLASRTLCGHKVLIDCSSLSRRKGDRIISVSGLLSPPGNQLLVMAGMERAPKQQYTALYAVDLQHPKSPRLLKATSPSADGYVACILRWSPDGTLVAIQSLANEETWLWVGRADGSGGRTLRYAKLVSPRR